MRNQKLLDAWIITRLPEGAYSAAEATKLFIDREKEPQLFSNISRRLNQFINYHATPDNSQRDSRGNAVERLNKKKFQSKFLLASGQNVARWKSETWKSALCEKSKESPSHVFSLINILNNRKRHLENNRKNTYLCLDLTYLPNGYINSDISIKPSFAPVSQGSTGKRSPFSWSIAPIFLLPLVLLFLSLFIDVEKKQAPECHKSPRHLALQVDPGDDKVKELSPDSQIRFFAMERELLGPIDFGE